jgi:hypothetical protein
MDSMEIHGPSCPYFSHLLRAAKVEEKKPMNSIFDSIFSICTNGVNESQ